MPTIKIEKRDGTVLEILVSSRDYEEASAVSWSMAGGNGSVGEYAKNEKLGYLHRWVAQRMGLIGPGPVGHGWRVSIDHEDGNKLNCQRYNLRLRTRSQQMSNSNDRLWKTNSSGLRGVSFNKWHAQYGKPWMAMVTVSGKNKNLGCYATPEEAADVRRAWEIQNGKA